MGKYALIPETIAWHINDQHRIVYDVETTIAAHSQLSGKFTSPVLACMQAVIILPHSRPAHPHPHPLHHRHFLAELCHHLLTVRQELQMLLKKLLEVLQMELLPALLLHVGQGHSRLLDYCAGLRS